MTNKINEICIDASRVLTINSLVTVNTFGPLYFKQVRQEHLPYVRKFDPEIDTLFETYLKKKPITFLQKRILIEERGDIPLDLYCLRAILEKERMIRYLKKRVRGMVDYIHHPEQHVFVDFSGTDVFDEKNNQYVIGIEFNLFKDSYEIVPYSVADEVTSTDFSLVFREQVIKKNMQTA